VIVVEQQTWATLLGVGGFALAVLGYLRAIRTDLKSDIARLETRTESGFARVESRLSTLEQRTFDLASRLPQPSPVRPLE
jgi:hypothetical protein